MVSASGTERATIATRTLEPGFNRPFGFLANTHISTVVLLGSSAGLTSETLAANGESIPGAVTLALSPTFNSAALCGERKTRP